MVKMWVKYVILFLYIVILVIASVLIGVLGPYKCVRSSCIRKAKFMLMNMNFSVHPCENFFSYSCDKYNNIVTVRKRGMASVMANIKDIIDNQIVDFLQEKIKVTDDRILKIIKKMYQPCIDTTLINLQNAQPLWDAIWMIGGFAVVDGDNWDESGFTIGAFDYKSRINGFVGGHIFESYVAEDMKNPKRYIIYIRPPEVLENPGREIVNSKYSKRLHDNYLSFIVRLTFHLLSKENYEKETELFNRYTSELKETIPFKIELDNLMNEYRKEKDPINLYNLMTLDNLQKTYPFIEWKSYIKHMLPVSAITPKEVVVIGTNYFKRLKTLIDTTNKRTIANFLMLENILEGCLFLPDVFFSVYNKFRINVGAGNLNRDRYCKNVVTKKLRPAISSLFLETFNITMRSKNILEEIAFKMRHEIKHSLTNKLKWMDDKTKENAILKLKSLKFRLSMTDDQLLELRNEEARAKYYEDLCLGLRMSHVLPSYFCINKFYTKRNWELLSRKATVFDEDIDVFSSEIKYNQEKNEILIPYSVIREPAFNGVWPTYLNYGGMGSLLGMIFTQGFDSQGAQFNDLGFNTKWWTPETDNLYTKQIQCFETEYMQLVKDDINMTIKKSTVNKVLPPNMARYEGINLAYQVFKEYSEERYLKEQTLPGLENYTDTQLFFLSYANIYCAWILGRRYRHEVERGNAVPHRLTIIGSLRNYGPFSEAFSCNKTDYMNPITKCENLW